MSGLGGGLETRRCSLRFTNAQRSTLNAQRSIQNPSSTFDVRRWAFGVFLVLEFCPNRGVIGGFFAFAHFAVDSRIGAFFGQRFTGQDSVDAQAAVFWEGKHPVIPPTEKT